MTGKTKGFFEFEIFDSGIFLDRNNLASIVFG